MRHMLYGILVGLGVITVYMLVVPLVVPWLFRFFDWYFPWVRAL